MVEPFPIRDLLVGGCLILIGGQHALLEMRNITFKIQTQKFLMTNCSRFLYGFTITRWVERIDRQIWNGLDVGTFAIRPEMAEKKNRENAGFFFGTVQLCRTPSFFEIYLPIRSRIGRPSEWGEKMHQRPRASTKRGR